MIGTAAYIMHALFHGVGDIEISSGSEASSAMSTVSPPIAMPQDSRVLFRSTALDATYGRLSVIDMKTVDAVPYLATLQCDRIHFAAGQGVCLAAKRGILTTYEAIIFGSDLQPRYKLPLSGIPSRVRASPDGSVAAITVFANGHSYATTGFSTLTSIIDLHNGQPLVSNLEHFTVWLNEQRIQAFDFNFWGVTFTKDANRFYATLGTGGSTHLVSGNLAFREVRVIRENIECPSLSPDNTRLAFKKRINGALGPVTWRLSILDLHTFEEWSLAESRSVDDQVEWLDDNHVVYSLPDRTSTTARSNAWVVPADGSNEPRLFLPKAYSPVIVRSWISHITNN
jgi:hypothetical protein